MVQLTRVRLQKGRHLVKRGEIWYLETCVRGLQERRSLGTGDLQDATRLAMDDRESISTARRSLEQGAVGPRARPRRDALDLTEMDISEGGRSARSGEAVASLQPSAFVIMLAIGRGQVHGYGIMQEIERLSGGRLRMGAGTLYRLLQRLLVDKLIEEVDGERGEGGDERRRTYRLSGEGLSAAREQTSLWGMLLGAAKARGLTSHRKLRG